MHKTPEGFTPYRIMEGLLMKKIVIVALSLSLFVGAAGASENIPIGVRAGFTGSPDQFHFGAHAFTGELFTGVDLTPNVEIGLGSGFTTIALNADFTYNFSELMSPPWGFYAGSELGLIIMNHDLASATDIGLSGLCGVTKILDNGHTAMAELKVGILDSPDIKITFGYTFF